MDKGQIATQEINEKVNDKNFVNNHKSCPKDFSRDRILTFVVVFMLILRKSLKSLQLALNELFIQGHIDRVISSSAYTQARKKFKHTAFVELNDDIVRIYYSDDKIKLWNGFRCLGVDGSKIILPDFPEIEKEYGKTKIKSQYIESQYCCGMLVCCYDVLNRIAVKSTFAPGLSYEVSLAKQMLDVTSEKDLLIYDRGFCSYEFLATLVQQGKNFIIRCPQTSFAAVNSLFNQEGDWSKIANLKPSKDQIKNIREKGLPLEINVRFVSVILSTGEVEVLATSLRDPTITRDEFKFVYGLRWGVETFYDLIKNRLNLENFTGQTAESIRQDLWSTIFISNYETVVTENIEKNMNTDVKGSRYERKVNKAVSFNVIKNMVFEIFYSEKDSKKSVEKMRALFRLNSTVKRPGREVPRKQRSERRSYNFVKRIKKMVF